MRNFLLSIITVILLASCETSDKKQIPSKKIWVYMEVVYTVKEDTIANFLYGRITEKDIAQLEIDSQDENLFKLTDGRYIDDESVVRDHSGDNDAGIFYFKYKNVVHLDIQKTDPLKYQEANNEE